jgi:GNAT superfamily N-acetyltransferase
LGRTFYSSRIMETRIRKATLEDLPILLAFEQGLIEAELPMDDHIITTEPTHYYDIPALIEAPDTILLVAETSNKEVIGCGYGKIMEGPGWSINKQYGHVGFMFVRNDYRGQGISNRIIDELCEWFRENNLKEARLRVYEKNPGAIKSYKRSGFEELRKEMRMKLINNE